jgi:hypothetical protein
MHPYEKMSREELLEALEMFAKNWLAHDGCWFIATEEKHGLDEAVDLDTRAWARFAVSEARRITKTFGISEDQGLEGLDRALSLRMYGVINEQHSEWSEDRRKLRFFMDTCRVQETRRRKGLPDFPCKGVGLVEFPTFARTVNPRIRTECLRCPPEAPAGQNCGWEFTLDDGDVGS